MLEVFPMSIPVVYLSDSDGEGVAKAYFKAVTEGYSMCSEVSLKTDGTLEVKTND